MDYNLYFFFFFTKLQTTGKRKKKLSTFRRSLQNPILNFRVIYDRKKEGSRVGVSSRHFLQFCCCLDNSNWWESWEGMSKAKRWWSFKEYCQKHFSKSIQKENHYITSYHKQINGFYKEHFHFIGVWQTYFLHSVMDAPCILSLSVCFLAFAWLTVLDWNNYNNL